MGYTVAKEGVAPILIKRNRILKDTDTVLIEKNE